MKIYNQVVEILYKTVLIEKQTIYPYTDFEEHLLLDAMEKQEVINECNLYFGITIPEKLYWLTNTVQSLADIIDITVHYGEKY